MDMMVQACTSVATDCEAASVVQIKELYKDLGNPPGNIDVIYVEPERVAKFTHCGWSRQKTIANSFRHCGFNRSGACSTSEAAVPVDDEPEFGSLELPGSFADYVGADDDVAACSEVSLDDSIETVRPDTAGTSDEEEMDDAAEASASVPTYADVLCYVDHIRRFACARDEIGDLLPDQAVYGFIKVEKKDCVNHVHKRMGAALRSLVDKKKAQGEPLGGKGRLTQDRIKKITNYYGWALRSHKNDVPGMKRAVEATLRHMSSTDDAPKHDLCPEGLDLVPLQSNSLPSFVCDALEPVFKRLSEETLLERCNDGMTQNASECLHSVIWDQAPKTKHASLHSAQRAVAEAISRFNQGLTKSSTAIAEKLGYSAGARAVRRSLEKDRRRICMSNKDHANRNATTSKLARRHKPAADSAYSPGLL
ncbi:hypothetical protein HPB52_010717 [Rhipicephalus sanguineus]|uniref:Mutator-like transposase domain-containing protein n=1 Tax=Rhipicephalus sanguineus TaxID=34632 RepID=A0A9D4PZG0_RHISA|nr:hypothetical protein HPB52_010717 [Rhipicephalus sanguineus]